MRTVFIHESYIHIYAQKTVFLKDQKACRTPTVHRQGQGIPNTVARERQGISNIGTREREWEMAESLQSNTWDSGKNLHGQNELSGCYSFVSVIILLAITKGD